MRIMTVEPAWHPLNGYFEEQSLRAEIRKECKRKRGLKTAERSNQVRPSIKSGFRQ